MSWPWKTPILCSKSGTRTGWISLAKALRSMEEAASEFELWPSHLTAPQPAKALSEIAPPVHQPPNARAPSGTFWLAGCTLALGRSPNLKPEILGQHDKALLIGLVPGGQAWTLNSPGRLVYFP